MSATFEWDDPNKLVTQVTELLRERGQAIRRVPDRAIRRGVFELLGEVQKLVPKKTSTLVRSITAAVNRISADVIEGKVGSFLEYARFIEEGTGVYGPKGQPITIVAKNKKALFWGAQNAKGGPLMARRVVIQGIKPRAPFATAVGAFLPRYLQIIEEELAKERA